jgi:hypothetical protein
VKYIAPYIAILAQSQPAHLTVTATHHIIARITESLVPSRRSQRIHIPTSGLLHVHNTQTFITMNARPHVRSKSNGLKPPTANARSNRPSLSVKRSSSYNHAAAHPSPNFRRQKSSVEVVKQSSDSDSEDMAASFLQFW